MHPYEAEILGFTLNLRYKTMCTAESCIGGLIGVAMMDIAEYSVYFLGGVVTYSNKAEEEILSVKRETLIVHGAMNKETAREMAFGVTELFEVDYLVTVTGIASSRETMDVKFVGLVYIIASDGSRVVVTRNKFGGGRQQVREDTVKKTCALLKDFVEDIL